MTRRGAALAALSLAAVGLILFAAAWFGFGRPSTGSLRLAFGAVEESLGPLGLVSLAADGTDLQPAYDGARTRAHGFLTASADSSVIAFVSYDPKDARAGHRADLIDDLGRPPRTIFQFPDAGAIIGLAMSPDGRTALAVYADSGSNPALHLVSIDTSAASARELSLAAGLRPGELAWSPDGSTIALVSDQKLWTMALDGTGLRSLTESGPGDVRTPAWSSDGSSIAFIARPRPGAKGQLFARASNGDIAQLSQLPGVMDDLAFLPRWSPDGTRIVFESTIDRSQMNVFVATTDGIVTQLNDGRDGAWDPRWTPDGSAIVFSAKLGGTEAYQLVRTGPGGGALEAFGPVFAGPISSAEWVR
jgi:hypothetical protein